VCAPRRPGTAAEALPCFIEGVWEEGGIEGGIEGRRPCLLATGAPEGACSLCGTCELLLGPGCSAEGLVGIDFGTRKVVSAACFTTWGFDGVLEEEGREETVETVGATFFTVVKKDVIAAMGAADETNGLDFVGIRTGFEVLLSIFRSTLFQILACFS